MARLLLKMPLAKINCVVFSDSVIHDMMISVKKHPRLETGGVYLGYRQNQTVYVIQSVDGGFKAVHQKAYFEYDQTYVQHCCDRLRDAYLEPIEPLGTWHRHPGSMDQFSNTDHVTNRAYAELCNKSAIGVLVNIDPKIRLSVYSVQPRSNKGVVYNKIPYLIGNDYIPPIYFKKKSLHVLMSNIENQEA